MKRVEYDINESLYCSKIRDYIFYFSSEFNLNRFNDGYYTFVKEEMDKLYAKYHIRINISEYLIFVYYKKIEKRGFKVLTYDENNDIIEVSQNLEYEVRYEIR